MTAEDLHKLLVNEFGDSKITGSNFTAKDPWIEVSADAITDVARFLKFDERTQFDHLNDLTGVDYFEPDAKKLAKFTHQPHVEVVYHLTSYTLRHRITIKVKVARWKDDAATSIPDVPSVSGIWAIADWHERECYDLVGVNFTGHPNLRRILCPEDWEGHPLRKDYDMPLEYHGVRGK